MIEKLKGIAVFAAVVDHGSFRAASDHLRMVPSRVSEIVSGLERDLGVTLLYRSTRQLSLTAEGRVLHEKAVEMLASVESGLDAINPVAEEPRGSLRVTAPAFVTQTELMDRLAAFLRRYPKVALHLDFTDTPRDLIKEGFDVSLRAGWLEDSCMMARSIGQSERLLVAHPGYVAAMGTPDHPSDLEDWTWVRFAIRPDVTELTSSRGEQVRVLGKSRLSVTTADALYESAVRGLGVATIPESLAARGIARGELVRVLPDWRLRPLGFYAVWPDQSRRENLTTLFVRFLSGA